MIRRKGAFADGVYGPDGNWLTIADIPSPRTKRWVARRKAEVITAVRSGLITCEQACSRYGLSQEEFLEWNRGYDCYGVSGLRVSRVQDIRQMLHQ